MLTTYNPDGLLTTPTFSQQDAGLGWSCVAVGANKISIGVEAQSGVVMTLNADGTGIPTYITAGLSEPQGIAVDAAGKIYVTNGSSPGNPDKVMTCKPDGTQTTPTITAGVNNPSGVAVDAAGKIYVLNYRNDSSSGKSIVTTYNPDGTRVPRRSPPA